MADDRRADHQYHSLNRPPDAKRPIVIHPPGAGGGGRSLAGAGGHVTTTVIHMPQSDSNAGRQGTPTPPPARRPSPTPARAVSGKPATFHIQIPGSNDVIPVHIPLQQAGGNQASTATAASAAALPRPASRGSPSAGAYVLHTGVVMPGGNVITVPATLTTNPGTMQQQRRTPSPKVATTVRTDVVGHRGLTPPPQPTSTSRVSPIMGQQLVGDGSGLLAPPNGGSRSSSPRSMSTSPQQQVPQLLITPAGQQAQILGVNASAQAASAKLNVATTAAKLNAVKQLAAAQQAQKLAAQIELNKLQQQQLLAAAAAAGNIVVTTTVNSAVMQQQQQKVLLSTAAPRMATTELVVNATGQQRVRAMPTAVSYASVPSVATVDPNNAHTLTSHSTSAAPVRQQQQHTVRRLPVNTEPQHFFASSHPSLPKSSASSAWSESGTVASSTGSSLSRANRPPNLPASVISNAIHDDSLHPTAAPVVPNGIDVSNGDHKGLYNKTGTSATTLDTQPRPRNSTSPANSQHHHSSNHPHHQPQVQQAGLVLPTSDNNSIASTTNPTLQAYQQLLAAQQQHKSRPQPVHQVATAAKSHSDIARSMLNLLSSSEGPMMPKLTPEKLVSMGQSGVPDVKVGLDQLKMDRLQAPFNMRVHNLDNFPASQATYRVNNRSQAFAIHRAKTGSITNAAKSLDLLRQNLQKHINQEIDNIIQRYMLFFKPGIRNIRLNNGESTVTDDHVLAVCRQILEEAKKMYGDGSVPTSSTETRTENVRSRSPSSRLSENEEVRAKKRNLFNIPKRRGSSDSDVSIPKKKKKGRPPLYNSGSGRSTPSKPGKAHDNVKREGPKWDPDRLTESSRFIMGAKANKALGLGNTRGRLYIKHPDVFKYSGDQDDKQWLFEHGYMPATGGKAYMLLEEDIRELAETDEYRANPGLLLNEIQGFNVPDWLVEKMKKQMQAMRSDQPKPMKNRSRSTTPNPTQQENTALGADPPLPFATMSENSKSDHAPSPSQSLDLLAVEGEDDLHDVSPYHMTGGFVPLSPGPSSMSPAPSDLDGLDDDTTPFGTTD